MKKLTALLLILALALSLSACNIAFTHEIYTRPEETLSTETFDSAEVPPPEAGTREYLMEEIIEDLVTGTVTRTEYIPNSDGFPVGMIVYENNEEVHREDWELDARGNIVKNTVTVNGEVTEIWEYELTYNVNYDIDQRISTLNGQWQKTEDFVYQPKEPFAILKIYVSEAGNNDPPWYSYSYKDGRVYNFDEWHAREPENYGKSGYGVYGENYRYDDNGMLVTVKVTKSDGGFYRETWDDYSCDDETGTITILTRDKEDNIIRRITRRYETVTTK